MCNAHFDARLVMDGRNPGALELLGDIVRGDAPLQLDVHDESGAMVGWLSPVTTGMAEDDRVVADLTRWRNQAMGSFLTRFEATEDRTRKWLSDIVLVDYSRLLLLLHSPSKVIGQYGFRDLTDSSSELDNLIRGETGGHPQLVTYAEVALIQWLFKTLGVSKVIASVLSSNAMALELHRRIGFRLAVEIPLCKVNTCDGEELVERADLRVSPDDLYYKKLEVTSREFCLAKETLWQEEKL
jgi:RimJ/RimL family protein N-acetyltransferase